MELRKNIKSCNINQGLMISHSQLTVIYKNDIYKSDTCVASFPGSPGTRKCIASIFCTFHVTKNTRLSTPAQLQCSHSRAWEPGNKAMIHVQCSLISRPPPFLPSTCIHNNQSSVPMYYCECKRKVKMGELGLGTRLHTVIVSQPPDTDV